MIVCIIQARMGSTRLPGKVMMRIREKPLLHYVINQVNQSKKLDNVIIATTTLAEDTQIVNYVNSLQENSFRGDAENVLNRYYECAKEYNADIIVRITADCPLIDPQIIDKCISKFQNSDFDYLSNTIKKENDMWDYYHNGFPIGIALEVFTFNALKKAKNEAKKPSEKEHVSPYIVNNSNLFKLGNIENDENQSDIRLTVDHQIDFDLIQIIIEHFKEYEYFSMEQLVSFLNKNPQLKQMNSNISHYEGYLKSLKDDKIYLKSLKENDSKFY